MKLIIQIPCLNEEESLPATLVALPKQIDGIDEIELLVIDDGSTDKTSEVARNHGVHHIVRFTQKRGLAKGFQAGLNECLAKGADIIVNTDADGQYKGEDIPRLVAPIVEKKADIVIGNRAIEDVKQFSWLKKRLQRLGTWVVKKLSGADIEDATTGFRAYSREAAMQLNIISEYTYTLESIIQAENKGLAIGNITIHTNHVDRPSRLFTTMWGYIKRSVTTILRVYAMFNPLKLFMTIGGGMTFIGFLIGCRFLYSYLMFDGTGKIQSLILAAVLLIIGFQLMVVGVITDLIAANRRMMEDVLLKVKRISLTTSK